MKTRTRSWIFIVCAALLLIWPAVALAYTYTFKIPVKVINVGDDRSLKAPAAKVDVHLYDASNNQIGSGGAPITLYDGDQTITITVNTTTPAASYTVKLEGHQPSWNDPSKSTLSLPQTKIQ